MNQGERSTGNVRGSYEDRMVNEQNILQPQIIPDSCNKHELVFFKLDSLLTKMKRYERPGTFEILTDIMAEVKASEFNKVSEQSPEH